jgi:micrococcal nuclease
MISYKNKYGLILVLLLISTILNAEEWIEVSHVYDGDTIQLMDGRRVRLIGINAPEIRHKNRKGECQKAEPFGEDAKQYLTNKLIHQKVSLEMDHEAQDHYHRILAYVFLSDGTIMNHKMVEQGLAYCLSVSPNTRYEKQFVKTQQIAMDSGKGIWKRIAKNSCQTYIGNKKSKRFHTPGCTFNKHSSPKNRIVFNQIWDYFYHGYAPCKKCVVMP